MRRILLPALTTIIVAVTVAACGAAPLEPEEPDLHDGTRTLQQGITEAGADCTWHNEPHDDYTRGTCGDHIVLVVTDDDGILDDFEDDYRDDLEYGFFVRNDSALGVSDKVEVALTLSEILEEEMEAI